MKLALHQMGRRKLKWWKKFCLAGLRISLAKRTATSPTLLFLHVTSSCKSGGWLKALVECSLKAPWLWVGHKRSERHLYPERRCGTAKIFGKSGPCTASQHKINCTDSDWDTDFLRNYQLFWSIWAFEPVSPRKSAVVVKLGVDICGRGSLNKNGKCKA